MIGFTATAIALLAGSAVAAPVAGPPSLIERISVDTLAFNITYQSPRNSTYDHLPKLLIMATGGTIAGSSASNTDSTLYTACDPLVEAVPTLLEVAQIDGVQFSNVGSSSLTDENALQLSKTANEALCGAESEYDGLVMSAFTTHGTDTVEETAFLLDMTVNCGKPVVTTAAMRPSSAISADGPNNLLQAARTAVSPDSRDRGALIVLNDRICAAYYCQKTQANTVDTFESPEQGSIGTLLSTMPFYYFTASQPTFKKTFDLTNVTELPPVEIFYGYQGTDFHLLNASVAAGAKGVVLAGAGAGSLASAGLATINATLAHGIPVVRSSKINNGFVVPGAYPGTIAAGSLNPVKARRMLQVLLATGHSHEAIRTAFEEPLETFLAARAA
ncbi:hypothetical protein JCM21900_003597 [Sporobolomyces salmonicolor]